MVTTTVRVCPFGAYDWVCNDVDRCFRCDDIDHSNRHPWGDVADCVSCKLDSVQLNPRTCHPSATKSAPQGTDHRNSWEKGVATDHRGIPFRDEHGAQIPIKKFGEKRKVYEESIRRNRQG